MKGTKLADFAKRFGISDRHARRLLNDHESELCGHFERNTRGTWIDDYAADFLRDLLRNPAEILPATQEDGAGSDRDYEALQAKYTQLLEDSLALNQEYRQYVIDAAKKLQEAERQMALAERSEANQKRADTLEAQNRDLSGERDGWKDKAFEAEKTAQEALRELESKRESERSLAERTAKAENELSELKEEIENYDTEMEVYAALPAWKRLFVKPPKRKKG